MNTSNQSSNPSASFTSKLTSRKFLAAAAGLAAGLAMVFGLSEETIASIAGAIVSVSSVMTYILTEGAVDKAALTRKGEDGCE